MAAAAPVWEVFAQASWSGLVGAFGNDALKGLPFGRLVGAGEGGVEEPDLSASGLDPETALTLAMLSRESASQQQGPPGANVFVFHIPGEWTRDDLALHFGRFGKIISIRVAQDIKTGRNKGYAFVNYFEVQAALAAVNGMDGFQVRLCGGGFSVGATRRPLQEPRRRRSDSFSSGVFREPFARRLSLGSAALCAGERQAAEGAHQKGRGVLRRRRGGLRTGRLSPRIYSQGRREEAQRSTAPLQRLGCCCVRRGLVFPGLGSFALLRSHGRRRLGWRQ